MSSGRHNVFRVSGIPSNCEAGNSVQSHAKSFLLEFIEYQYQPHERGQIEPDIQIVPSCTVSCNTVNALVEFESNEPEFLRQLLQNRDSCLPVSRRVNGKRDTIYFDLNFDGLTQLYPTPPDQTVTVDIVAITGLGGHAYGSWRSRTSPMMWLRDFLSEDMPRCRTMTYGYNSQLLKRSVETVEDYRRRFLEEIITARDSEELRQRPIVFICHSFGGIILAEALIHAKLNRDTNPDMEALSKSTYGIFFLGVPHRGLWVGDMLDMLRSIHPNHPREELVKQLQVDSLSLKSQLDKFRNLCQDYELVSFYELGQTRQLELDENSGRFGRSGQFRTAVTSESALLQLPDSREKKFGFPVDHSDIAKFSERYSGPYKIALRYLQIFEKGAPEAVSKRFGRIELLYPRQETSQSWHES